MCLEATYGKLWLQEVTGEKEKARRKPPEQTRAEIAKACKARRATILSVLADGATTNIKIVNATGYPATTIKDDLKYFVKNNLAHSTGKARGTRWHLGPEQVAA